MIAFSLGIKYVILLHVVKFFLFCQNLGCLDASECLEFVWVMGCSSRTGNGWCVW